MQKITMIGLLSASLLFRSVFDTERPWRDTGGSMEKKPFNFEF
jgi:hypothetical protein